MGQSTKAVCTLVSIGSATAAAIAWTNDRPDAATWGLRIGGVLIALLAIGTILKLHFRVDREHDYLRQVSGKYFNRDGFCFAFVISAIDGVAFLNSFFQSQRDQSCIGRIALRPARGFFMTRAKIDLITFEIECPPAGFGFARIAIPIPEEMQGKWQSFEVGASVRYPEGYGKRVRFFDGIFLRSNTKFRNSFGTALTLIGAATGSIVLSRPATVAIALPTGVAENIPPNLAPETKILWQLGASPLESVA